ncbi:accessory gene regulator B [Desulfohalotomaculum tongense]|uniref:accessory gene regulator ArgB-like protein n=1 Tax=Desulforadius tongensis TaxID=1216062 RepID=UPI00195D43A3|nr:accessory gene regulator B family protein [Desulforadius tongensis]MBM7854675.1 accessory gene regulator B [Desulforadius tongensis]
MIHKYSVQLAKYLSYELNLDRSRQAVIAYGLEVLIGGTIKILVFISIPWLFGIFPQFIAAFLSSAFLRLPSGGVHCSAYYRCLISSLLLFLFIAAISKYLVTFKLPVHFFLWFSLLTALITFIKLAPVDVKEKPIRCDTRRKILKIISCLMPFIYLVVFNIFNLSSDIILASSMSILFHTFTLTNLGHKFFRLVDKIL